MQKFCLKQSILLLVIRAIHLLFVVYVTLYPFINPLYYCSNEIECKLFHVLYLTMCVTLLVHWYAQNDTCFLTYVEACIRGKEVSDGFLYSIISPIYKVPTQYLTELCYTIVIFNFTLVLLKLAHE